MSANAQTRLTIDWAKVITKEKLKELDIESLDEVPHPNERFCTRSEYEGTYNALGFSGTGRYKYPHGAIYEGEFKNGDFHGQGTITYPMGQKMVGIWNDGKLLQFDYLYKDGLKYQEPWQYCQRPDRRFHLEVTSGLIPAGAERLTNDVETKNLQENCYDTIYGYYNDVTKAIYNDMGEIRSIANAEDEAHIKENYRFWIETPMGYRPDLYEEWTTGKEAETEMSITSSESEFNMITDQDY